MDKIIISGCNGTIGKELVKGYAEMGFFVYGVDLDASPSQTHQNFQYVKCDISNENEVNNLFNVTKSVNVLINNGGISNFQKSLKDIDILDFEKVIKTNLIGTVLMAKKFVENFNGDYGRIVNVASTRFHQNEPNWEAYGASKGGIVAFTNSLCVSLENTKITVNCVSPGWIASEKDYDAIPIKEHRQHPSGRVGKPKDIFNACAFLTNPQNDFVNGTNLIVDGGMTKKMIYLD